MSIRKLLIVAGVVAVFAGGLFAGRQLAKMGSTDSPGTTPAATSSYTLEDIWKRLDDGTPGSMDTFGEPSGDPTSGTMYTLNDIMGRAPERDSAGATAADVLSGKAFWGLTVGEWGLRTGTMPEGDNVSGQDGSRTFSIPDGAYSGKTATANDADLVADKIKKGVTILGVYGSYRDQDRFTDHGDGTVTDHSTRLMWTKNANLPDARKTWQGAVNYCAALDYADYSDWRLPRIWELYSLIDERVFQPSLPYGHPFTDIPGTSSYYWSSTTSEIASGYAYYVWPLQGEVGTLQKTIAIAFVWPVRDP